MVRLLVSVTSGVLAAMTGALGLIATVFPPTDDAAKAHFIDGIILVTILTILAIAALGIIEYREREKEKYEREKHNRYIAELHMDRFSSSVTTGTAISPASPVTLRSAIMNLAKSYRDFAKSAEKNDDDLLTRFWAKHPFKELDDLKQRIKVYAHFETTSSAEWLPNSTENILKIANRLEKESSFVPADALL